jgi:TldD protein
MSVDAALDAEADAWIGGSVRDCRVPAYRLEAQMLDRLQDHAKGFDGYTELRWHANHAVRLAMRKGALLQNTQTREGGVSARCYRSGAFGFACHPGDTDEALGAVLAEARANAALYERAAGGEPASLPQTPPGTGVYDYRSQRSPLSPSERTDLLRRLDDTITRKYPGLLNTDLVLSSLAIEKALVTSEGAATYSYVPRTVLIFGLSMQANDGPVQLSDHVGGFGDLQDQVYDLEPLLERVDALYTALREKAEGTHCDAGVHDVVLDPMVAGILAHEAIGHTCEADSVLSGSVAGDRINQQVASEKITLGDYGGRGPDGKSDLPIHIDDEGTPCRDVTIIENGVLKAFLHNKDTARRLGAEPTGNARAFAFGDEPLVRMRNTAILPGTDRLDDMIAAVDRGYYLMRSSNGQADWTSEFMFGITRGYEIHNGKLGRAIRDTTISGVAFDMLKTVSHVGDTLHWMESAWCGKKQLIPVGMGGPALKCRITLGGQ